jgi:hypothetical protein
VAWPQGGSSRPLLFCHLSIVVSLGRNSAD